MGKVRHNQDNRVLWVLLGILVICFLAIGILFYRYFYAGTSSSKYGERLDGIENYPLGDKFEENIKEVYKGNSSVGDVTVTVEGKIIYITIDFKESVKVATAKDLAIKSLDTIEVYTTNYFTYNGKIYH